MESVVAYEAIADPIRRRILDLLRRTDLTAGRIASHFPVSRPAISRHLKVLRRAGLVRAERRGRLQVYRLDAVPLGDVSRWVQEYERFWTEGLTSFKRHLEEDTSTMPVPGSLETHLRLQEVEE
jgi:DNA-binding transcriptional ArsR family regulator